MIASAISALSRRAMRGARLKSTLAAAAVLALLAPQAKAQGLFFFDFDSSPQRIERRLEASGYELRGPLYRRGDVYFCDVMDEMGGHERLVIDARTASIVERFRSPREREARSDDWRESRSGDWRDRDGDDWNAPPRPPRGIAQRPQGDAYGNGDEDFAPPPRPQPRDQVARTDPAPKPPTVIYGVDGQNGPAAAGDKSKSTETDKSKAPDGDKANAKPHVAKKKPAKPAADAVARSPAVNPSATDAAPSNTPPAADNSQRAKADGDTPVRSVEAHHAANSKPPAETTPSGEARTLPEMKPVVEAKPAAESKSATVARPALETKPAPDAKAAPDAKPLAEAKAAPAPEPPRPAKKAKPVNDVPVNPLD